MKWRRTIGRLVDDLESTPSSLMRGAGRSPATTPDLTRDVENIATGLSYQNIMDVTRPVSRSISVSHPADYVVRSELTDFEDNRLFTPARVKPLRTTRRIPRLVSRAKAVSPSGVTRPVPWGIGFSDRDKKHTILCVRRKIRRGVIFAKTGGGGGMKKPRRNRNSNIWC